MNTQNKVALQKIIFRYNVKIWCQNLTHKTIFDIFDRIRKKGTVTPIQNVKLAFLLHISV